MGRTPAKANKPAGRALVFERWPKAKTIKCPLNQGQKQHIFDMSVHDSTQPIASIDSERERKSSRFVDASSDLPSLLPIAPTNSSFDDTPMTNNLEIAQPSMVQEGQDEIENIELDYNMKLVEQFQESRKSTAVLLDEVDSRVAARTMGELLDQIKAPIEEDTSKVVVMEFDESWVSLAKAPTQKKRREVNQGTRLFTDFCKKHGIKCIGGYTGTFPGILEEQRELRPEDFRLRNLVDKRTIIYVWIDDDYGSPIELRTTSDVFLALMEDGNRSFTMAAETAELIKRDSDSLPPFSEFLHLDRRVPERWTEYMNRDRNNRSLFIRFLCSHLLSSTSPKRLRLREGSLIIVNAHHMNEAGLLDLGFDQEDIDAMVSETKFSKQDTIRMTPISISYQTTSDGKRERFVKMESALLNKWGETDFGAFYFARALGKQTIKFITTDTDWIYYALMYLLKAKYQSDRRHLFSQRLVIFRTVTESAGVKRKAKELATTTDSLPQTPTSSKKRIQEWIDVNLLYELIRTDPRLAHLGDSAVSSVVAANTLAGCDYMYPFYFVNHYCFFYSLIEFAPLVNEPWCSFDIDQSKFVIEQRVFLRYLSLAYALKFVKFKAESELFQKSAQEIKEQINQNQKDKKKHFPTPKDCAYSYKQLLYCFHMMNDLGDDCHSACELTKFGYASSDPQESNLTYDNIERLIDVTA